MSKWRAISSPKPHWHKPQGHHRHAFELLKDCSHLKPSPICSLTYPLLFLIKKKVRRKWERQCSTPRNRLETLSWTKPWEAAPREDPTHENDTLLPLGSALHAPQHLRKQLVVRRILQACHCNNPKTSLLPFFLLSHYLPLLNLLLPRLRTSASLSLVLSSSCSVVNNPWFYFPVSSSHKSCKPFCLKRPLQRGGRRTCNHRWFLPLGLP